MACCLLLTGCVSAPKRTVSAIPIATSESVYVAEHAGLAERAAERNLHVYWNGPGGGDGIARQVDLVERAIHARDFGIVLSPASAYALNSVIEQAVMERIPVVILGPPLQIAPSAHLSYVTSDVERTGALAAQRIHATQGSEDRVLIAGIDPTLPGSQACARAFEVELRRLAPQVRVTARLVGTFSSTQSAEAIESALEEHPEMTVIYALGLNDARGAAEAIQKLPRAHSIRIVGNSYSLDTMYDLRRGTIDALVVPDMRRMGAQAIDNLVHAHGGEFVPVQSTFVPTLLTRENLDEPAIQDMIKLDWRR